MVNQNINVGVTGLKSVENMVAAIDKYNLAIAKNAKASNAHAAVIQTVLSAQTQYNKYGKIATATLRGITEAGKAATYHLKNTAEGFTVVGKSMKYVADQNSQLVKAFDSLEGAIVATKKLRENFAAITAQISKAKLGADFLFEGKSLLGTVPLFDSGTFNLADPEAAREKRVLQVAEFKALTPVLLASAKAFQRLNAEYVELAEQRNKLRSFVGEAPIPVETFTTDDIPKIKQRIDELKKERTQRLAVLGTINESKRASTQKAAKEKEEHEALQKQLKELNAEYQNLENQANKLRSFLGEIGNPVQDFTDIKDIPLIQQRIEELKKERAERLAVLGTINESKRASTQKAAKEKDEHEALQKQLKELNEEYRRLEQQSNKLRDFLGLIANPVENFTDVNDISLVEQRIAALKRQRSEQLAIFQTVVKSKRLAEDKAAAEKVAEDELQKELAETLAREQAVFQQLKKTINLLEQRPSLNKFFQVDIAPTPEGRERQLKEYSSILKAAVASERLAKSTAAARAELEKLSKVKQFDQFFGSLDRNVLQTNNSIKSLAHSIVHLLQFQLISRGIFEVTEALRSATKEFTTFSIRIAEIQTLSQRNQLLTSQWADQVIALSNAFGNPLLETAEGVYEAISNQVAEGADVFPFMQDAMELSVITLASLEDSVNAITGVINSFTNEVISTNEAQRVLFKTVDLGRVRLDELANTIGRVSPLSNQLGITFNEQQAALAALTNAGIRYDTAQTLMVNILQKLIRPSKEMTNILNEWGVSSGEAAIKTFGFVETLRLIEQEAKKGGDELAEIGEIFLRIRATTGFLALDQERFKSFLSEIAEVSQEADKALQIVLQSQGKKLEIELNKVKNFFTNELGRVIVNQLGVLSTAFGGLDVVTKGLVSSILPLIGAYAAYKAAVTGLSTAISIYRNQEILAQAITLARNGQLLQSVTVTNALTTASVAAASVGIAAITAAFIYGIQYANTWQERVRSAASTALASFTELNKTKFDKLRAELDTTFNRIETAYKQNTQNTREFVALIRRSMSGLVVDLEKFNKNFATTLGEIYEPISERITKELDAIKSAADDTTSEIERAIERLEKSKADLADKKVLDKADKLGAFGALDLLSGEATALRTKETASLEAGRFEEAAAFAERAAALEEEAADRLRKAADEAKDLTAEEANQKIRILQEQIALLGASADRVRALGGLKVGIDTKTTLTDRGIKRPGRTRISIDPAEAEREAGAIERKKAALERELNDLREGAAAKERLAVLEETLAAAAERRLATEELILEKAKETAEAERVRAEEAAKAREEFDALVDKLTEFTGSSDEFAELMRQAFNPDLNAKANLVLEEREALITEFNKKAQQLQVNERAGGLTKELDEVNVKINELDEKFNEAKDTAEKLNQDVISSAEQVANSSGAELTRLLAALNELSPRTPGRNTTSEQIKNFEENKARLEEAKKAVIELQSAQDQLRNVNASGDAELVADSVEEVRKKIDTLREALQELTKVATLAPGELVVGGLFGSPLFGKSVTEENVSNGALVLDAGSPTTKDDDFTTKSSLNLLEAQLEKLEKQIELRNTAIEQAGDLTKVETELKAQQDKVQEQLKEIGDEFIRNRINVEEWGRINKTVTEEVIEGYDGILDRLQRIYTLQRQIIGGNTRTTPVVKAPGAYRGGLVAGYRASGGLVGFPGGPHGRDTQPIWADPREYISNPDATRRYYPFLEAMNRHPQNVGTASHVVNLGDITINMQGGSNTQQNAHEMVRLLRREIRRGTLSL